MKLHIDKLEKIEDLKNFNCGVPSLDKYIQSGLWVSVSNHYCQAYLVKDDGDNVVAMFALSFDSLFLDREDKTDLLEGFSQPEISYLSEEYIDIFLNKTSYPALEIAYLAVDWRYCRMGIGREIIECIVRKAQSQELAGCQFITVDALSTGHYSATGFYTNSGFAFCEYPSPAKSVVRMFRSVYTI